MARSGEDLLKTCIKLTDEAKEVLGCPICFDTKKVDIEQCVIGHNICKDCKVQVESCPICKHPFNGTKNFAMSDISEKLENITLSLDSLDKGLEALQLEPTTVLILQKKVENYRQLIKRILQDLSESLFKSKDVIQFFSEYLKNPNNSNQSQIDGKFKDLTTEFEKILKLMKNSEKDLKSIKK